MDSVPNNVQRIYPESKTGLIQWIEENFHDIDEFIFCCTMKSDGDNPDMFVYDCYTYRSAIAMLEIAKDTAHALSHDGDFKTKERKCL